jgi:16S rRNA (cytidine1402-2'-O)-methyltransferase
MQKGKLYLIPNTLGSDELKSTIPAQVLYIIESIDHYIVENIHSAAHFLKLAGLTKPLKQLTFYVLNINTKESEYQSYLDEISHGNNIGIISEAGMPCIADPGSEIVSLAHKKEIPVVPLAGPSSILMALAASGLNGQSFAFNGYLPLDKKLRSARLMELEKRVKSENQTQILIEAPHRNDKLLEELIDSCSSELKLSLSIGLTTHDEKVITRTIGKWKNTEIEIGKIPTIFIVGKC